MLYISTLEEEKRRNPFYLYAKQNNEQFGIVIISNYHKTYCLKTVLVSCWQFCGIWEELRQALCRGLVLLQPDVHWGCSHLASVQLCWAGHARRLIHMAGNSCRLSARGSAGAIKQAACAWLPQQAASGNWTSYVTAASLKARNSGTCISSFLT